MLEFSGVQSSVAGMHSAATLSRKLFIFFFVELWIAHEAKDVLFLCFAFHQGVAVEHVVGYGEDASWVLGVAVKAKARDV